MAVMLKIDLPPEIRACNPLDWRQLGDITAEAFADDPINNWIFGTGAARQATFSLLARETYLQHGICHMIGDQAATMWCLSDERTDLRAVTTLKLAWHLMTKGTRGAFGRAIHAGGVMDREHPAEPHLYLFTIGTRKSARGKGLGKAILRPMLEAADRASLPCYLENSNPDNTGFYGAHGFERVKLFEVGKDSPPLEAMWREPRAS